ncbi:MAG: serine/threonine protein kinase [Myxococcales bacterium]|nr:serine/threonine protein kinase [Myxococcales bacterium]
MDETLDFKGVAKEIAEHLGVSCYGLVGSGAFKHTFHVEGGDGTKKALKLYKASANERTDREVAAIKKCDHPNIAHFERLDVWDAAGTKVLFSIEEYLDGGTLADVMKVGPVSADVLRRYARQLVDALEHVAALGLVHRDVKPDNIMLRIGSGDLVLVDFGLVRDLSRTSLTKTWAPRGPGTPYYSSPEQLNNEKALIDWRSDQFSLGLVLAEAGFGRHPFLAEGADAWTAVEAMGTRKPVSDAFGGWAGAHFPALLRMLAPWPVGRFRTPNMLRQAWLEGEK